MSEADTSRTVVDWPFAGRSRRFQLRIGEIGELERLCGAGVGEIMLRLAGHRFYARDVWETIRLALEGGGEREALATALVARYQAGPIADYIDLSMRILEAAVSGTGPVKGKGRGPRSGKRATARSTAPATSPSSTEPGALPA